jgi:hypothetical protein
MNFVKALFRASLASIIICVTAGSSSATYAIELTHPAAGQARISARDKDFNPLGIHAGGFYFFPAAELGASYNDNIYYVKDNSLESGFDKSDYIANLRSSVSMNSNWNRHEFNLLGSADLGRYKDHTGENYEDYVIAADGQYDVMRRSFATGRAGYMRLHESRSSLDDRFGKDPTEYDYWYLGTGYDHQPARFRTLFTLDFEKLDFDNVTNIFNERVDNHDRDRGRTEAILRLGYENMPNRKIFIQGAFNSVDYDQRRDDQGLRRSSDGYKITAGMNFNLTHLLVGDVFAGYVEQDYDDSSYEDISDPLVGFHLTWTPTMLTTVDLNLDRTPQETTEPAAAGYLSTVFTARVGHELRRNIILFGNIGYTDNQYEQSNAPGRQKDSEDIISVGLGGEYQFSRRFYATAEYRYQERNSDISSQDYKNNQVLLNLGANW